MVQYKDEKRSGEEAESATAPAERVSESTSSCVSPVKSDSDSSPASTSVSSTPASDRAADRRSLNDSIESTAAARAAVTLTNSASDGQTNEYENAPADRMTERQLHAAICNGLVQPTTIAIAMDRSGSQMTHSQNAAKCYLNGARKGNDDFAVSGDNCYVPQKHSNLHGANRRRPQQQQSQNHSNLIGIESQNDSLLEDFNALRLQRPNRSRKNRRRRQEMHREQVTVHPQALVLLNIETTGKQADELGTDETPVARISFTVFHIETNKVLLSGQRYVRPDKDDEAITEESRITTGITPEDLNSALPLDQVLLEIDSLLASHGLVVISGENAAESAENGQCTYNNGAAHESDHAVEAEEKAMEISSHVNNALIATAAATVASTAPHTVPYNFLLVVDGPAPLRMVLHPEITAKNVSLSPFWFRYFDLRKEFRKCHKVPADTALSVSRMLEMQQLPKSDAPTYGQRVCDDLLSIVADLTKLGHKFIHPEVIKSFLEPGICLKNEFVDDDCVVRARGLPWQSTDQDVAKFFSGLNIEKGGVALCLTKQGRRNGEALVRFESREYRDLAVQRHKHHLKQRYIEVYRAGGRDFVNVAAGRTDEGHIFLQKLTSPDQCIVRMRGLPYTCTAEQILNFFSSGDGNCCEVQMGEDGVLFVHHPDGRATGDAFVLFANEEEASKALAKHKESIGNRYIELFRSTMAEVQQVLNQCHETPKTIAANNATGASNGNMLGLAPQRSCLHLRGLPAGSTVADILSFLDEQNAKNIMLQGVHLVYNAQGLPIGEAFIQMNSEVAARAAALAKSGRAIRKHPIDVRQCFPEEMSLLMPNVGLLPTPPVSLLDPAAAALQAQLLAAGLVSRPAATFVPNSMSPRQAPLNAALANVSPDSSMNSTTATAGDFSGISSEHHHMMNLMGANDNQNALPPGANMTALAAAMQMPAPLFYWYPSPPISPQQMQFNQPMAPYYMNMNVTNVAPQVSTVVLRGVPVNVSPQDLLHFFDGVYETAPEIHMGLGMDGRPSGDIYVTFGSRIEAERAVAERNLKFLCNKPIEIVL